MRRLAVLASVLVVLTGLVAYARGTADTAAQDATPAAMADHPVVGGWRWENVTPEGTFVSYAVFHPDGTYVEASNFAGVAIGVWAATGERSAALTEVFQDIDPSVDGFAPGTGTVWVAVEVDETGNAISARAEVELRAPDGTVTFRGAGIELRATRLAVEPAPPVGAPLPGAWGDQP